MKCNYCGGEIDQDAQKCRHCGEWLTEDGKKKALKDAAALQKNLEREKQAEQSKRSLGCCTIIFVPFVIWIVSLSSSPSTSSNIPASASPTADVAAQRKAVVDNIGPEYCEASKKTTVLFSDDLKGQGWPSHASVLKSGFTADQCATIVGKLFDRGVTSGDLHGVARHEYWVGMDYMALYYSLGTPSRNNKTTTILGDSAQLVYDWSPKTVYIYLDGQKVSSFQN